MVILLCFSLASWAVILSKWAVVPACQNRQPEISSRLRKAAALEAIAAASEQFNSSPLVAVFDFGYSEVARQMKSRGSVPIRYRWSVPCTGTERRVTRLERNMSVLATTATGMPFIGLFGTVWGIIDAFHSWARPARQVCAPWRPASPKR